MEAVDEIMRTYRSLPARPSVDDVEAAEAVIRAAETEEEARLEEVERAEKHPDLPEELFHVLQEVRRSAARLRAEEQRREALRVVDLEERFRVLDELIQRASRLVSPDGGVAGGRAADAEAPARLKLADGRPERKRGISDASLVRREGEMEKKAPLREATKVLARSSSLKSGSSTGTRGSVDSSSSGFLPDPISSSLSIFFHDSAIFQIEFDFWSVRLCDLWFYYGISRTLPKFPFSSWRKNRWTAVNSKPGYLGNRRSLRVAESRCFRFPFWTL